MATDLVTTRLFAGFTDANADVFFSDEEVGIFISEENSLREAAAAMLEAIAANKALTSLFQKTLNHTADTRSIANDLRKSAASLRKTEREIPFATSVEQGRGPIGRGDILDSEFARSGFGNTR